MKIVLLTTVLLGTLLGSAHAQTYATDAQMIVAAVQLPRVKGVIRRIDTVNSVVTIKHDEIPNLQMPAMTMPFDVPNIDMLAGFSVSDKILFTADEVGGELTVMSIEKRP